MGVSRQRRTTAGVGLTVWLMASLAMLVAGVDRATAATIYANATCSLAEAIASANTDSKADIFCIAGSGADIIVLGYSPTLTTVDNVLNGNNGLPVITSEITIESDERLRTIERSATAGEDFRLFYVDGPDGDLTLRRLIVRGGRLPTQVGGCIRVDSEARLRIESSEVIGCMASLGGGVRAGYQATVSVLESTFDQNWAQGTDCRGGAISAFQTTLMISRSTLSRNWAFCAEGLGGALDVRGNYAEASHTTFSQNLAGARGGAIWSGSLGGEEGAYVNVLYSTFAANQLGVGGVGSSLAVDAGSLRLLASIVDDSFTSDCAGTIVDDGRNFGCGNPVVTHLDSLGDNGGLTLTHALLEGSNAIDTGGDCFPSRDQRGAYRDDGSCDSGSFEYYACTELHLHHEIIDTQVQMRSPPCRLVVGPNWGVVHPGSAGLRAGREVVFLNDSWVDTGGELEVEVDPVYLVP